MTNIYQRLGVPRLINGHHWRTILGGSIMPPEVVSAMADSSGYFVDLEELHEKAGQYISHLTGADRSLVTAGCSAAMVLQAAACMTGNNEDKIASLPDSSGMKNEIIIQKSHRNHYDTSYQLAGAKLVEIGSVDGTSRSDLEKSINENTAAIAYVWIKRFYGLSLEEVVEIGHDRNIPIVLDAASELPPVENLSKFIDMGTDLIAFSGGKGIRGPQSTGILTGRKDLMDAAYENNFFFGKDKVGIGRPMKVCKEEIVGLITALELFVEADHETEWVDWKEKSQHIIQSVGKIEGIKTWIHEGPIYEGPTSPTATIELPENWKGPTVDQIEEALRKGDPSIHIGVLSEKRMLWVAPVALQDGEDQVVANRIIEEITR